MADEGQHGTPEDRPREPRTPEFPAAPPQQVPYGTPPHAGRPPQHGPPPQYVPPQQHWPHQQQYGQHGPYGPPPYDPPPRYGVPGPSGWYGPPPPHARHPYGAGYGPPAAPPPARRGTRGRLLVLVAVAVVAVAVGATAAVLLAQRGGTRVLSTPAVQRDVARQFQAAQGVPVTLTCDRRMPLVTGASYTCSGVTGQGEPVTLTIRITDAQAATYTWTDR